MTSFNVGGRVLDLPAKFKLQFVKKNAFFAFDDLEVERTTTFAVPKTPNNLLALGFANDFHRRGEMMRRKVEAQMQNGLVTRDGYLYVGSFNGSEFECIFVTGDLLFLQAIKELGDWSEYIPENIVCRLNSPIVSSGGSQSEIAARVNYRTDGNVQPSWLLPRAAELACANAGASVQWGDTLQRLEGQRIIAGKPKGVPETPVTMTRWYVDMPTTSAPYPIENNVAIAGDDTLGGVIETDATKTLRKVSGSWDNPVESYGYAKQWIARQDLSLHFSDDTPANIFIGTVNEAGGVGFIGGYSFTKNSDGSVIITGEPLAGRDVEITTGQTFLFFTPADLHSLAEEPAAIGGWSISNNTLVCSVIITGAKEQPENAVVRARDNVPEMTIVELLKVIAALTGQVLSVDNGNVVFVENVLGVNMRDDLHVIKWGELTRTFSDYAQRNIVKFESDEQIVSADRLQALYTINNVNLTEEKELLTIPMSEGDQVYWGSDRVIFVRGDFGGYTLALGLVSVYMQRVSLIANGYLQGLCNASTSVVMECRFSALDFERLTYGTRLWFDGSAWVWNEAQWSNNVARFALSRI